MLKHRPSHKMKHRRLYIFLAAIAVLLGIGFVIPEQPRIPVAGATSKDWNPKSFWYEQWGVSGVHKGIDVFAPQAGKPPHLHYTVVSLIPWSWRFSSDTQGWKKMFFLDPGALLHAGATPL